ncbi:MAG: Fic family protein [Propionibacteriaceae bacterium]|nr:Fic family protein [Propionibacteriaceae bacterium]
MEIPATPPPWKEVLRSDPAPLWLVSDLPHLDSYPHWDDLLRHEPPEDLTHEQWWVRLKTLRLERAIKVSTFRAGNGDQLWYTPNPTLLEGLAEIAPAVSGGDPDLDQQVSAAAGERDLFIEWTLREEAIASAQLAGVKISRSEALPRFDDQTLADDPVGAQVWNNYLALVRVLELAGEEFSPELVRQLNAVLSGDGALRTADCTDVTDPYGRVWHSAPPAHEIAERLEKLCRFANRETDEKLPPLLAAMTVHYMAVHDQYFAEANNRTARLLFYWAMFRCDFWLAKYLSISKVMAARGLDYRRTFLLTDTDDGDLTYFFEFSTSVLRRSIWQLRARLETELNAGNPTRTPLLGVETELNHRQLKVLETCLADPRSAFSYETHEIYWGVSYETARRDLRALGKKGLLRRRENTRVWQAPENLAARLRGEAPKTVELGDAVPVLTQPELGAVHRLWRFVRGLQPGR